MSNPILKIISSCKKKNLIAKSTILQNVINLANFISNIKHFFNTLVGNETDFKSTISNYHKVIQVAITIYNTYNIN